MALKLIIPEVQSRTGKMGKPTISINSTGIIMLSVTAKEKLEINAGDHLALAVDEGKPLDWYLIKVKEEGHGIPCKVDDGKKTGPKIQCSSWTRDIRVALGETGNKYALRIPLSTQGEETELGTAYALLTKVYLDTKKKA